jgi:hypothetical protein
MRPVLQDSAAGIDLPKLQGVTGWQGIPGMNRLAAISNWLVENRQQADVVRLLAIP